MTDGANDETKARYAFVYGDLRRVHRTGLIACVYRASEWRHKDVELAAHELLQRLDAVGRGSGLGARRLDPDLGRSAAGRVGLTDAGWSSSVARWAHNPEVAGSNPVPATT